MMFERFKKNYKGLCSHQKDRVKQSWVTILGALGVLVLIGIESGWDEALDLFLFGIIMLTLIFSAVFVSICVDKVFQKSGHEKAGKSIGAWVGALIILGAIFVAIIYFSAL